MQNSKRLKLTKNMKKFKLILIINFFLTFLIQAQNGKISGTIIDKKTGETLPGASVLLEGTTQGASSDFDGNYTVLSVKPGVYNVICKYVSYANKLIKDVTNGANLTGWSE
jgi:hypothetical protein